ncbi:MAG: hypothetical protein ACKOXO_12255 [Cyanobium sp.]
MNHPSATHHSGAGASRSRSVLRLWSLALALSAALAAAGRHWPQPLAIRTDLVWALVLIPPLLMALLLLRNWRLPAQGDEGQGSPVTAAAPSRGRHPQGRESEPSDSDRESG